MNVDELKAAVQSELKMDLVYEALKEAYANDEAEVHFQDTEDKDPNSRHAINNVQADLLRSKGYSVIWNSPCQWWEVSGWKE